ncbi:MAG: hypothetical protein KC421_27650, partial [Anaerolineales bacterium]|nr:hypothetical protein [Anaerolineales bacterium]
MTDFNQAKAERYLKRPLPDLLDELALYDDTVRGAGEVWQKIAAPVRQRLCVEWNWCEVRQDARFENDYDLLIAIFAKLTVSALDIPFDVDYLLIAAIALKRGLD